MRLHNYGCSTKARGQSGLLRALCGGAACLGRISGWHQSDALAALIIIAAFVIVRRNEQRLADEAERALPVSLDAYQPRGKYP